MNEDKLMKFSEELEEWIVQYVHDNCDDPQAHDIFQYLKKSKAFADLLPTPLPDDKI